MAARRLGTEARIQDFLPPDRRRLHPMFAARPTSGKARTDALFQGLTEAAGRYPDWNFRKYLLDREGRLVGNYLSITSPRSASHDRSKPSRNCYRTGTSRHPASSPAAVKTVAPVTPAIDPPFAACAQSVKMLAARRRGVAQTCADRYPAPLRRRDCRLSGCRALGRRRRRPRRTASCAPALGRHAGTHGVDAARVCRRHTAFAGFAPSCSPVKSWSSDRYLLPVLDDRYLGLQLNTADRPGRRIA